MNLNITSIDGGVFYENTFLTKIEMPYIKTVGFMAFSNAKNLTEVNMLSVVTVDEHAFAGTQALTTIHAPASFCYDRVTSFQGCPWQPKTNGITNTCQ